MDAHGTHDGQALEEAERWGLDAMTRPKQLVVACITGATALQEMGLQRSRRGH